MASNLPSVERLTELSARNLAEFFTGISPHVQRWDDLWAADLGSDEVMVNSCANLQPLPADIADLTARLDAFYGQRDGQDWLLWSAWPTSDLSSYGFTFAERAPLMARAPNAEPVAIPPGFRIEEARTLDELAVCERGFVDWYPLQHFRLTAPGDLFPERSLGGGHHYLIGYEGERPVCVATAFVEEMVVGVYAVATAPEARGKGYGAAISDAAAQTAPGLPAVLQASDMGRPVYERIGFTTIGHFSLWTHPRRAAQTNGGRPS